ncbi:hypothetical protein J1614_007047 [Plenodomus biglobosus]|nr:hypothetical protein J1614_007047 [Plenodomus biglobosus]
MSNSSPMPRACMIASPEAEAERERYTNKLQTAALSSLVQRAEERRKKRLDRTQKLPIVSPGDASNHHSAPACGSQVVDSPEVQNVLEWSYCF